MADLVAAANKARSVGCSCGNDLRGVADAIRTKGYGGGNNLIDVYNYAIGGGLDSWVSGSGGGGGGDAGGGGGASGDGGGGPGGE